MGEKSLRLAAKEDGGDLKVFGRFNLVVRSAWMSGVQTSNRPLLVRLTLRPEQRAPPPSRDGRSGQERQLGLIGANEAEDRRTGEFQVELGLIS